MLDIESRMSDISSLTSLYDLSYPDEESIFIDPSLLQLPIDYKRVTPQGLKGIDTDRGLDIYDISYIFHEGIVTPVGMLATFPSSYSLVKDLGQTIHTNFTPLTSVEPVITADYPGAP
jgi:hypothetical protein